MQKGCDKIEHPSTNTDSREKAPGNRLKKERYTASYPHIHRVIHNFLNAREENLQNAEKIIRACPQEIIGIGNFFIIVVTKQ